MFKCQKISPLPDHHPAELQFLWAKLYLLHIISLYLSDFFLRRKNIFCENIDSIVGGVKSGKRYRRNLPPAHNFQCLLPRTFKINNSLTVTFKMKAVINCINFSLSLKI
jgi:hypothetical protein